MSSRGNLHKPMSPAFRTRRQRRAFSLVEALIAISIMAMAGSVLLLSVDSSLQTTTDAVDRTIADGMAQQLLDEITTKHFTAPGSSPLAAFGPNSYETSGSGRERYNDTDDFYNFTASPPEGIWGEPLGTGNDFGGPRNSAFQAPQAYLQNWRQRVEVYFVDPTDNRIRLTSGTSTFRGIEVSIERIEADGTIRPLATRKRVIAYVQPPTY